MRNLEKPIATSVKVHNCTVLHCTVVPLNTLVTLNTRKQLFFTRQEGLHSAPFLVSFFAKEVQAKQIKGAAFFLSGTNLFQEK